MMRRDEFRVEEYNGEFRVQRVFTREEGKRRKKKTIWVWRNVDEYGRKPRYFRGIPVIEAMGPFEKLELAKDLIETLIKGETYHYE